MKKERGSVTIITLTTILFIIAFVVSTFTIIANRRQAQAEIKKETQAIYESEIENMDAIYNSYFADENETIPIYTLDQLFSIGTGEKKMINNKIYVLDSSANYKLMNDIQFNTLEYIDKNPNNFETINSTKRWINIEKQNANGTLKGEFNYNSREILEIDSQNNPILHSGYVETGLILHYDGKINTSNGHNSSSGIWQDVSGNDNNGTLINFTNNTWMNNGLKFDGISNYVNTSLIPSQELGGTFTISANFTMENGNNYRDVWGAHEGNFTGIVLQCEDGNLDAAYGNGSAWQSCFYGPVQEILNKNVTITVVYEQGKSTTIYCNGAIVAYIGTSGNVMHTDKFWVGKGFEASDRYFQGIINNILVYNRALNGEEILSIYQMDYARF